MPKFNRSLPHSLYAEVGSKNTASCRTIAKRLHHHLDVFEWDQIEDFGHPLEPLLPDKLSDTVQFHRPLRLLAGSSHNGVNRRGVCGAFPIALLLHLPSSNGPAIVDNTCGAKLANADHRDQRASDMLIGGHNLFS